METAVERRYEVVGQPVGFVWLDLAVKGGASRVISQGSLRA